MGRNTRRTSTPQRRKTYTRLGARRVVQGVEQGTYIGGLDSRIQAPVSVDE
jgi:hypothetical protein